jgi:hypothetical protein
VDLTFKLVAVSVSSNSVHALASCVCKSLRHQDGGDACSVKFSNKGCVDGFSLFSIKLDSSILETLTSSPAAVTTAN